MSTSETNDTPSSIPSSTPAPPEPGAVKLSHLSKGWRFGLAAIGLVILAIGQVLSTNDWFPLGSLSQYSYGRPLDSPTRAVRIIATNTEGKEVRVPLNPRGVGVGRAEIEGQLQRILDNPSMLEGIARAWHGLHPHSPQYTHLRMERTTAYVKNGVPTGEMDVEVLTEWDVQGNFGADK